MQIRPARSDDLAAITNSIPERHPELHSGRLRSQEHDEGIYLIAWEGGRPVGHVMLMWPWWPEQPVSEFTARYDCSWVEDLFVQPQSRNKGIGRRLMEAVEAHTRTERIGRVGLAVGLDEGYTVARHLYESVGYRNPGHGTFFESVIVRGGGVWMDWLTAFIKELRES